MAESKHTPTDWQPIETAPKDGTRILGVRAGRDYVQVIAHARGRYRGDPWRENHYAGRVCMLPPTHWMPLPKAPGVEG